MSKHKQPRTGGSQSLKDRGLVGIVVPLTPEERTAIKRAAALSEPPLSVTRYAAKVLTEAAHKLLARKGL